MLEWSQDLSHTRAIANQVVKLTTRRAMKLWKDLQVQEGLPSMSLVTVMSKPLGEASMSPWRRPVWPLPFGVFPTFSPAPASRPSNTGPGDMGDPGPEFIEFREFCEVWSMAENGIFVAWRVLEPTYPREKTCHNLLSPSSPGRITFFESVLIAGIFTLHMFHMFYRHSFHVCASFSEIGPKMSKTLLLTKKLSQDLRVLSQIPKKNLHMAPPSFSIIPSVASVFLCFSNHRLPELSWELPNLEGSKVQRGLILDPQSFWAHCGCLRSKTIISTSGIAWFSLYG